MNGWLSYQEAGERLEISAEAVRQRAMRGRWPRRRSNEGVALVQIPEGVVVRRRTPVEQPVEQPDAYVREHPAERLVAALQAHIETLKAELEYARAELAAEREAALTAIRDFQRVATELASMKGGHAALAGPSEAAVKRAENLVDILQRMRERQATKAG